MAEGWPATLPAVVLVEGYQERWAENVVRSPTDVGPAKLRRRSTAGVRRTVAVQLLTTAQVATLKTFFDTTLAYGSLSFDFTDPRTEATVEARYVTPPVVTEAAPGRWRAVYDLEILP